MQLQLSRSQAQQLLTIICNVWDDPAIKAMDMYKEVNQQAKAAGIFKEHEEFSDENFRKSVATIKDSSRNFSNFATRKRKLAVSVDFNFAATEDVVADNNLPAEQDDYDAYEDVSDQDLESQSLSNSPHQGYF